MMFTAKSTPVKASGSEFEQLIQMSQNAGTANEQKSQPVENQKESAASVTKAEQPETPANISTEKNDMATTAEEKPELGKAEGKEEATDVEAAERVAGVLNQITEVITDVLGISEEELNQFMEQLGITDLSLVQPETLKNLVLMTNSEQDAVVLLTDDKLLFTVNELISQVEQILQEAGVTPEELADALAAPDFEALVEEVLGKQADVNVVEKDDSTRVEEMVVSEKTEVSESTAKTTVELHTEGKDTESSENKQDTDNSTQVDNIAEHFLQNLKQAAEEISEITGQKDIVQMIREIADQILEKVKISVNATTTSLEIVLTPEELGKVNLTVSAEQDGTMKAKFVTENELAREAIERNLVQFKETLQEQGLKVDTIEVTVGNFEFDKNGQTGESSQEEQKNNNRRFITDEEISQKDETDQLAKVFLEGGESTVNYMA